jgi:putative methionine-R-sulfoxide reductase with GAF domain
VTAEALAAVDELVRDGDDADDVLRAVVAVLVERGGCSWAGILFVDDGQLVLGPEAGMPAGEGRTQVPVVFNGDHVADLAAEGGDDGSFLEQVAQLIAPVCLVGWDTGGVPWEG